MKIISNEKFLEQFNEYRKETNSTNCYEESVMDESLILGLANELLELYLVTEDYLLNRGESLEAINKERGDVLWYLSEFSNRHHLPTWYREDSEFIHKDIFIGKSNSLISSVKKFLRGDFGRDCLIERVKAEIPEITMYFVQLNKNTLQTVLNGNLLKLKKRAENGTIKGDGDNR